MKNLQAVIALFFTHWAACFDAWAVLPDGFVYLKDFAPSIQYDIRYAGEHNFIGRPVKGYYASQCILTKQAANALANLQKELLKSDLTLKVFDCYRPQQAVNDFIAWSRDPGDQLMKEEFYPNVDKRHFFKLGYVAEKSGHSRGSTVDVTIEPTFSQSAAYARHAAPIACIAPYTQRFRDGGMDMGTSYDCMDESSHSNNRSIGDVPYHNRMLLKKMMIKYGFTPYKYEWWHFTLKNEPFPKTYFDFPVQ